MAISKIIYKESANATPEVWMDATPATAAAADITAPKTAMLANGVLTTGTGSGGGGGNVFVVNLTLNTSTQMWEPDKTLAQIRAAHDLGNTPVCYAPVDAWNYNSTWCGWDYDAQTDYFDFVYQVSWFDFNTVLDGNQYADVYMFDSGGISLIDRQETAYPPSLVAKTITSNGTYNPMTTDYAEGYSLVTVNVPQTVSSKNIQIAVGCVGTSRTALMVYVAFSGQTLTVAKTGIYDVYWTSVKPNDSTGYGTQLYIDGVAYGNAETTFSDKGQAVHLSGVSLTEGQRVALRGTTPSTTYIIYGGNLTLIEA